MDKNLFSAKWIWANDKPEIDEYSEFYTEFEYKGGSVELLISADSNYTAYLGGKLAAFGQYSDFPYDKVYDRVDVTKLCKLGVNKLGITVWYNGSETTSVYYPGIAALIFCVCVDGVAVATSSENVLSRKSVAYCNHEKKIITWQLGYSYHYDVSKEDNWLDGELSGFTPSVVVDQNLPLRPRPCKKLEMGEVVLANETLRLSDVDVVYDLGVNTVGFLYFAAESDRPQKITVSYGEHIVDGNVRRLIGGRDFSALLDLPEGRCSYQHTFRRFGCRYIQITSEAPLTSVRVGIAPTDYPLTNAEPPKLTPAEKEIYDACVRTLRLCMHEHYEDCPWREQALYTMDSRNQMLCGYYAFREYTFPRSCLQLISKDNRPDGLLSICYPIKNDLVIPSFSLHYFTECREYLDHTGDVEFIREIYPKLKSVLQVFIDRRTESGVVKPFEGAAYWNFYEWRKALDGYGSEDVTVADLPLNALFSLALSNMQIIADALGVANNYGEIKVALDKAIKGEFYDEKMGLFRDRAGADATYSVLSNSLAVLCGAVKGDEAALLCEKLISDSTLTPVSLSMKCFLYDALLLTDREKYTSYIFDDIETTYRPMVDFGVGTVWETELGEADFHNAGSLCHGWSALPIYYYHTLKS